MKSTVAVGSVCLAVLLWLIYWASDTTLSFPEPAHGYRNQPVGYDDLPPSNATAIDLGSLSFGSRTKKLGDLKTKGTFDGFEVTGMLDTIASKQAKQACIAVDFTRRFKQEHQLIASHSQFFEIHGGRASFRLPIRFPEYDEAMDLTVLAIVLDDQGVPIGSDFTLATGSFTRPVQEQATMSAD